MHFRLRYCLPALMLPLFGCGPVRNQFPPECPSARLVPSLSDVTRYAGPGPVHDLTDMVLQARVISIDGKCTSDDDNKSVLPTKVNVSFLLQRGPAMKGREADVPVFLAVVEGENVLDKRVFHIHLTFPPNVDRVTINSPPIDMALPVSAQKTGAAYGIIAGFQLTPEELAANRQGGGG
jgi:hypothetical protein